MKKIIILFLTFLLIITNAQNQPASKSIIQNAVSNTAVFSPNATALFRYSETPVSLYTGVPDITIPLYTIKEGDIEVPISISYHAGGIKVSDEASSVGLGWSLNAGGRVSHIMAGENDFSMYGYYNIYPKNANGYIGSVSNCPTPTWNNSTAVNSYYTNNYRLVNSDNYSTIYPGYDFQPDLFLINMPGKIYRAYLDMSKTTKTDYPKFAIEAQPNINFKLVPFDGPTYSPNSNGKYTYTLVDDLGLRYEFDGAVELSTTTSGGNITGASRYLTRIHNNTNKKVDFFYSNASYGNRLSGCKNTRYNYTYSPDDPSNPQYTNLSQGLLECNMQYVGETFIEKIEFSNGKIEFIWSDREDINNSKKLSSIKIYNNYRLIKQYDFNYSYFVATDILNTGEVANWLQAQNNKIFTHRLKLTDLTESLSNEKYVFDYNTTYNLPNKLSFSSDFWGYYNGQTNSDSFIPAPDKYIKGQTPFALNSFNHDQTGYWYEAVASTTLPPNSNYFNFTTNGKHYLSDRRSSLNALAGILTAITYPTGGKTEFEYELNTFSNFPLQSLLDDNIGIAKDYSFGGGVRIKSIKSSEKAGALPIIKNFIYEELNQNNTKYISHGNLIEFPSFYEIENRCFRMKQNHVEYTILSEPDCLNKYSTNTFYPEHPFKISVYEGSRSQGLSTLPQGGIVGYSKVIEQVSGKGRTENYFVNNFSKSCLTMIQRGANSFIGNGDLMEQRHYNNSNELLKETLYQYKFNYPDNLNTYFISGSILEPVSRFVNADFSQTAYPAFGGIIHNYSINLYKSLLETTTTKEYYPAGSNNFVETKTSTTYNNKYQPKVQKVIHPDNSYTETAYNYAQEKGNQLLTDKNMVGIPLETIISKTDNGVTKTLSKTEIIYPTSLPDAQTGDFALPKSVVTLNLIDNSVSAEVTLDRYDIKGNLIQYTTKDSNIPVSVVWGYNYTLPIAKIEGVQYDNIGMYMNDIISLSNADALNPTKEQELLNAEDNLRKNANLSNYQITTYTYDPLIGVTSVTPPSGIKEYYRYDTTNRLDKIVDANNNILKEFKYRYATASAITYFNTEKKQTFTRTNCSSNQVGGNYTYTVPAGTYTSDISQLAADQKALDDINNNGQNITNQNGSCSTNVSCPFTFSSVVSGAQYKYNNISTLNNNVNFNVTFSPYGIWQNWSSGVNIGTINGDCKPTTNKEIVYSEQSNNRQWKVFINANGNCTAMLISGNLDGSSSNPVAFNFQYQK